MRLIRARHRGRWLVDPPGGNYPLDQQAGPPYQLRFWPVGGLGDQLVTSAVIRNIKLAYGDEFKISVAGSNPDLWKNNPDIEAVDKPLKIRPKLNYQAADKRPLHLIQCQLETVESVLKRRIPYRHKAPVIVLTGEERAKWEDITPAPYVVLDASCKGSPAHAPYEPAKWAGSHIYQQVTNWLVNRGFSVVQVGDRTDTYKPLIGADCLVGQLTIRQTFQLIHGCSFAVGRLGFLGHICAALDKPYVCVAGGREPLHLFAYPRQVVCHTLGDLACCQKPCWRWDLNPGTERGCVLPVIQPDGETIPACMQLIGPEGIVEACYRIMAGLGTYL